MYGCTEAFLADMKWILHNCIIYNGGRPLYLYQHPPGRQAYWANIKTLALCRKSQINGNRKSHSQDLWTWGKEEFKNNSNDSIDMFEGHVWINSLIAPDEWDRSVSRMLPVFMPKKGKLVLWAMCKSSHSFETVSKLISKVWGNELFYFPDRVNPILWSGPSWRDFLSGQQKHFEKKTDR